jgi:4-hydroxy-tetrahydrodipicolinate synthase
MKRQPIFEGAATALITPLTKDGVDYPKFKELIEWQIAEGINALVIAGTSGEASTLTDEEHREVLRFAVEVVNGRVPVIAGTGSNDTDYAIDLTKYACEIGCDAMLVVTPYYNKATQKGLIKMFTAIADASTKPIILYNVPSRTGVNIEPSTYKALCDHENIIAIKEANGDISKIVETMSYVQEKLDLYSCNDDQIVPLMSLGGKGVISVVSNILPAKTVEMAKKCLDGDYEGAAKLQYNLHAIIDSLFSEVNPIPVKAAPAKMGYGTNTLRLPLTPMSQDKYEKLLALMKEQGINV